MGERRLPVPPKAFARALGGVLDNALAASELRRRVGLTVREQGGALLLSVRDQGTGMTQEVLERAVEPFFSTKGSRGLGLGLFVIHQMVEGIGGAMELRSVPGEGTTVELTLPTIEGVAR